jgi:hypothetical protein
MNSSLLIVSGASFVAGLLGYTVIKLWVTPIVRYNIAKRRLGNDLSRYLAQVGEKATIDKMGHKDAGHESLRSARKNAMALVSGYSVDIPYWYRLLLDSRKESPTKASGLLTNLSKIGSQEQLNSRIESVRRAIGLK